MKHLTEAEHTDLVRRAALGDAMSALARPAPEASAQSMPTDDLVQMPTNEDQAAGMVLLASAWLKEHAPHRLTASAQAVPAESLYPHVGFDENGFATLEWSCRERKVTIYLQEPPDEQILKSWGANIDTEMEYILCGNYDGMRSVFDWLKGDESTAPIAEAAARDVSISIKHDEWTTLSPDAQAKLMDIGAKGVAASREQRQAEAVEMERIRSAPLAAAAAPSAVAEHSSAVNGAMKRFYEKRIEILETRLTAAPPKQTPPASPPVMSDVEIDRIQGLDTATRVRFYEHDFYPLSNFSAFRLTGWGRDFDTAEHAYHWHKFPARPDIQDNIQCADSAHEAFKYAERMKPHRRPDWDDVKVGIMREILQAKAKQHEYVRRKLLATGDRELVEDSWRDDFWGWGPNRDGQNMLGKLWMELRAQFGSTGGQAS